MFPLQWRPQRPQSSTARFRPLILFQMVLGGSLWGCVSASLAGMAESSPQGSVCSGMRTGPSLSLIRSTGGCCKRVRTRQLLWIAADGDVGRLQSAAAPVGQSGLAWAARLHAPNSKVSGAPVRAWAGQVGVASAGGGTGGDAALGGIGLLTPRVGKRANGNAAGDIIVISGSQELYPSHLLGAGSVAGAVAALGMGYWQAETEGCRPARPRLEDEPLRMDTTQDLIGDQAVVDRALAEMGRCACGACWEGWIEVWQGRIIEYNRGPLLLLPGYVPPPVDPYPCASMSEAERFQFAAARCANRRQAEPPGPMTAAAPGQQRGPLQTGSGSSEQEAGSNSDATAPTAESRGGSQ